MRFGNEESGSGGRVGWEADWFEDWIERRVGWGCSLGRLLIGGIEISYTIIDFGKLPG